jgi:hypothetical protein
VVNLVEFYVGTQSALEVPALILRERKRNVPTISNFLVFSSSARAESVG